MRKLKNLLMYNDLKNKVAIIAGANGSIGNAIANELFRNRVKLALLGRNKNSLISLKKSFSNSKNVELYELDIRDGGKYKEIVKNIYEKFGNIDVLINNAGITRDNLILRMKDEEWEDVISTNLKGCFNGIKICSKYMIKNNYGSVINISSVIGIIGNKGQANYAASKAGIIGLTKALSKEFGKKNIRVNCIAPGFIQTEMTNDINDEIKKSMMQGIPLNRFGLAEDVSSLVSYLSSKKSSYITGQTINVDGGMVTQ